VSKDTKRTYRSAAWFGKHRGHRELDGHGRALVVAQTLGLDGPAMQSHELVNDREADAIRLAKLIRGITCKVNLIPFNPFPGSAFRRPSDRDVLAFQSIVRDAGIDVFIRKSRGRDVLGACGQLGNLPPAYRQTLTQIESRC